MTEIKDLLEGDTADEAVETDAGKVDAGSGAVQPVPDGDEADGGGACPADEAASACAGEPEEDGGSRRGPGFWHVLKRVFLFAVSFLNPKNLFSGKMISIDFILHRWKTLLVLFCMLMFYISNRYSCQQKVTQIGMLRKEVEELGYRSLDMFVRLKRIQKEEAVIKAVQDSALNLHYPDIPPYIILDKEYAPE